MPPDPNDTFRDTLRDHHERLEDLETWRKLSEPTLEIAFEIQHTLLPSLRKIVRNHEYAEERRRRRGEWLRSWQGILVSMGALATFLAFLIAIALTIAEHVK